MKSKDLITQQLEILTKVEANIEEQIRIMPILEIKNMFRSNLEACRASIASLTWVLSLPEFSEEKV